MAQGSNVSNSHANKLLREDEERLVERLYTQSVMNRKRQLAELDARFYPVAQPPVMSNDRLQQHVVRQVDQEMGRRADRAAAATERCYSNTAATKKLSSEEQEESVHRMYDETLQRMRANMAESRRRYEFDPSSTIRSSKMPSSMLKESVERLSKPKKTEWTTEEINKAYGLA